MKKVILALSLLMAARYVVADSTGYVNNLEAFAKHRDLAWQTHITSDNLKTEFNSGLAQATAMAMATETGEKGFNIGIGGGFKNGESAGAIMFTNHSDAVSIRFGVSGSANSDATVGMGAAWSIK